MPATRTAEVRNITLIVSGVPDLPNYTGTLAMVPDRVEIEYRWQHPEYRNSWFEPGRASVKVHGPRRLKSGKPGDAWLSVDFHGGYGKERPDWLVALVAEYMPAEFAA
jgi:hypothetical protein